MAKDLGGMGEAPPRMFRRCGWLNMTFSLMCSTPALREKRGGVSGPYLGAAVLGPAGPLLVLQMLLDGLPFPAQRFDLRLARLDIAVVG